jgi:hypothetical protein
VVCDEYSEVHAPKDAAPGGYLQRIF